MTLVDSETARQRSPRFPGYDLRYAEGAIRTLYEKSKRALITREVAVTHLGFKGINGSSARALAALNYYGLVEGATHGRLRISDSGVDLVFAESPGERYNILLEALLKPSVFRDIADRFGGINDLPSDAIIQKYLVKDREFSDAAAKECIQAIRVSSTYLSAIREEALPESPIDDETNKTIPGISAGDDSLTDEPIRHAPDSEMLLKLPFSDTSYAEVRITVPLTRKNAERFGAWLDQVVKPHLSFLASGEDEEGDF